ncbi:hypothetical protein KIW84_057135 [Lathyrus oleraceus]|uniref:USP domain-containing protein n=1 Tax=Pisum sativum TaxID=3888 RepID=A0A9D4X2F4_PEA|nr:hypothetical protein KIW84_057135 [Pisum sativum]
MTQEAVKYAFYFLIVGAAIWESSWAEISCWMWTGGRQSTRMRIKYLEAALDQDICFFDTEVRTSDVVFAINADAVMVQDAISEKLAVIGGIHTTTLAKLYGVEYGWSLGQFTAPEILDKDNKYNCGRCKSYEKAKKKLTVLEAPNILTIVLKRFQSGNFEKLNKSVQFPEVLNMAPYISGLKDKSPIYRLYAVVVHLDSMNAAYSGHYVCYVKNIQGEWFRTDDSRVEPVELSRVLSERAYMLLYARHSPKPLGSVSSNAVFSTGKFKRRNLEAIPDVSKTRSNSMATSADSSSLHQKHVKHSHGNTVDDSFSREPAYPEEWRFNYQGRNTMADSSSESSLFSSSDASSCST